VEALTDQIEADAEAIFEQIRSMAGEGPHEIGQMTAGILRGIEDGWFMAEIADAAFTYQQALDAGATAVTKLTKLAFGDVVGRVRDPLGNIWWVQERLEEPSRRGRPFGLSVVAALRQIDLQRQHPRVVVHHFSFFFASAFARLLSNSTSRLSPTPKRSSGI
jgi:hypothetical protein